MDQAVRGCGAQWIKMVCMNGYAARKGSGTELGRLQVGWARLLPAQSGAVPPWTGPPKGRSVITRELPANALASADNAPKWPPRSSERPHYVPKCGTVFARHWVRAKAA